MAKLRKDRLHVFSQPINQKSVQELIKAIAETNAIDDDKNSHFKKYQRKPIQIIFNTNGGSVYEGLGLISAIQWSKTPVHITVMGRAMSMGLFILSAADKRMMSSYSTLMYHQISTASWDKIEGLKATLKESERLEKVCEDLLFKKTKLTSKLLEPYKQQKKEWYITPKEALRLGIVDKLV